MIDRQPCGLPIAGLVRAVRRRADLSQRELARRAGVSRSSVSRLEAGTLTPSLGMLSRLMHVADVRLVAVDSDGHVIPPVRCWDDTRDGADRHYPAHLDTILDPRPGEWWADRFGLARPPETFHRDRALRNAQRTRSQWEVRVSKYWATPEPPVVPDGRWRRVD
jgi:transcriptional regulator with XRE-family HTH domain